MSSSRRVLFLVPEDWYFLLHRAENARQALRAGYDVHVATHAVEDGSAIEAEGFHLHRIDWRRGSFNPLALWRALRDARKVYRAVQPDVVHHVTLSAVLIGGVAGLGLRIPSVNSIVGLGTLFVSPKLTIRLLRNPLRRLLRFLLNRPSSIAVFENPDDAADFVSLGVKLEKVVVIAGAAFDIDATSVLPEPEGPFTIAYVGRMLADKGVRTLVEAFRRLVGDGRPYRLLLVGRPDASNATSLTEAELAGWSEIPQLSWLGHRSDIQAIWAQAHLAALPSRREGLPQSLLEAAAYGRSIVATDVPGCREVAKPGVNAILVPTDDAEALARAIDTLAQDAAMRSRFAIAGRELVVSRFSRRRALAATIELYDHMSRTRR